MRYAAGISKRYAASFVLNIHGSCLGPSLKAPLLCAFSKNYFIRCDAHSVRISEMNENAFLICGSQIIMLFANIVDFNYKIIYNIV